MRKDIYFKAPIKKVNCDYKIQYINEVEYRKLLRGLKEINMLAYKQIVFKNFEIDKKPGKHEITLESDDTFKKVHGDIKLIYSTIGDTIVIEDLQPNKVLLEYHSRRKGTYNGVPFVDAKDIFKINLIKELKENEYRRFKN